MADPPVGSDDPDTPGGPYSIGGLAGGDYYLSAYLDRDGSGGSPDPDEPSVWYDTDADGLPDAVTVSSGGAVTGKDIALGFIYVDADATQANDGTSWANAYTSLSFGLLAAVPGLEVWVAEGSYKPGLTRGETFILKNGVESTAASREASCYAVAATRMLIRRFSAVTSALRVSLPTTPITW